MPIFQMSSEVLKCLEKNQKIKKQWAIYRCHSFLMCNLSCNLKNRMYRWMRWIIRLWAFQLTVWLRCGICAAAAACKQLLRNQSVNPLVATSSMTTNVRYTHSSWYSICFMLLKFLQHRNRSFPHVQGQIPHVQRQPQIFLTYWLLQFSGTSFWASEECILNLLTESG